MDIQKTYDPKTTEDKWYAHWMKQGFFKSTPNEKEPFTIVIPPPNITGILHMGHVLNNTIQDILTRRARLQGKNALWVPGTDHASIATEARVVAHLKEQGINKEDITREKFLEYAWEWKEKYGGIILKQLRKLGASCDWDRTTFTMDPGYYDAVIKVFVDLYNKGYIYRGARIINWDPDAQTALSDEEVIHREVDSKFYYVKYKIENEPASLASPKASRRQSAKATASKNENENDQTQSQSQSQSQSSSVTDDEDWITIATTRPETILGDTAICVHPDDKRYQHLKGKTALVPLINRSIPFIFDDYVDMELGTGALKVTPAHDAHDYELGVRHKLETVDILNDDGTMSEAATMFVGEDRFVARKKMVKALEEAGQMVKIAEMVNKVGFSERTNAVIEPKLSVQWFCSMTELAKPALENVMNSNIRFHPDNYKNTYRHWMENIKDWCISRQLWWGQQIPVYYLPDGEYVVAVSEEEALQLAREKSGNKKLSIGDLKQDEDVLDTWFSSWLWPIALFDGFTDLKNKELQYYYPTNTLVTGPEIIFFWVARMIVSGYEYLGDKPFSDVYFTGTVRDEKGRKMSKSLGNSPDPLNLIDQFGADAVRFGIMVSSPAGGDLLYDDKLCEQGRNFCNKIWNAMRLIKGWEVEGKTAVENSFAISWFDEKFNATLKKLNRDFNSFHVSEALKTLYSLIWDDFCSWYLEMVKPAHGETIDQTTYDKTIYYMERLMAVLHPFMPFITEEVWHILKERKEEECIIVGEWPAETDLVYNKDREELFKNIVTNVRNVRKENNIAPKQALALHVKSSTSNGYSELESTVKKLAVVDEIHYVKDKIEDAASFRIGKEEFFIHVTVNKKAEKKRISQELEYAKGFLKSVQSKLKNDSFVQNAPEKVVESERKKAADAEEKIKMLEASLKSL